MHIDESLKKDELLHLTLIPADFDPIVVLSHLLSMKWGAIWVAPKDSCSANSYDYQFIYPHQIDFNKRIITLWDHSLNKKQSDLSFDEVWLGLPVPKPKILLNWYKETDSVPHCHLPEALRKQVLCDNQCFGCIAVEFDQFPIGTTITFPNGESFKVGEKKVGEKLGETNG